MPVEEDAAGGRPVEPQQQPRQRRLARAGLADEPERLPAPDRERDVVDGADDVLGRAAASRRSGARARRRRPAPRSSRAAGAATGIVSVTAAPSCGHRVAARRGDTPRVRPSGSTCAAGSSPGSARTPAGSAGGTGSRAAAAAAAAAGPGSPRSAATRRSRAGRSRSGAPRVYGCTALSKSGAGRAALDDPPRVHHLDVVAEAGGDAEVVRDQDHRHLALVDEAPRAGR